MDEEEAGDQRLLAYVVARTESRPANVAIRAYLEPRVPAHMMPSGFIWMEKLPLTPSGKLDRLALSGAAGAGAARTTEFVAPGTPTEQTLSGIWREVLAVDCLGVDNDFFDLGGHSLHVGRILARVSRHFGVEVQFRDLFDSPTIAGMAQIIDRERARM